MKVPEETEGAWLSPSGLSWVRGPGEATSWRSHVLARGQLHGAKGEEAPGWGQIWAAQLCWPPSGHCDSRLKCEEARHGHACKLPPTVRPVRHQAPCDSSPPRQLLHLRHNRPQTQTWKSNRVGHHSYPQPKHHRLNHSSPLRESSVPES